MRVRGGSAAREVSFPIPSFCGNHPLTGERIELARMAYYPGDQMAARQLDGADGVIDGTYYGNRVAANPGNAARMDAADGVMDGRSYGRPVMSATQGSQGYDQMAARQLDGADGVVDGTYYGNRVAANPGSAARMDAADGVMDGRSYGQPVMSATNGYGRTY